jgi:hypothetical protein
VSGMLLGSYRQGGGQNGIVCPALRVCHVAKQTKCNGST